MRSLLASLFTCVLAATLVAAQDPPAPATQDAKPAVQDSNATTQQAPITQQEQPGAPLELHTGISVIDFLSRQSIVFPDLALNDKPMTTGQKFKLFVNNSISPAVIVVSAAGAGIGQARDDPAGYGQGAEGYGKRFGASMARGASSNFFGGFVLASLLHEDPRFFVKANLTFMGAVKYSLVRVVVTRNDDGTTGPNYSGLAGPLAAEFLANTYYPKGNNGVGDAFERYGIDMALRAGANLLKEYWPTLNKRLKLPLTNADPAAAGGSTPQKH